MQLYNIKTNDVIAYVVNTIKLTTDINMTIPMGSDFNIKINEDGSYDMMNVEVFCMEIVERIYKKHESGSMSHHTYGHIREEFFEGIPKHYVWYRVVDKVVELRRLKLKKIYG